MQRIRKSINKRFKITKTGKIMRTASGINHFQAKKRRSKQLAKKRPTAMSHIQVKMIKAYLHH